MVIPVGYAQINIRFTGTAVPTIAEVTFGVINGASHSALTMATNVEAELIAGTIMDNLTDGVVATNIHVKLGPNATGASVDLACNVPGTVASETEPPNCAFLIRKITSLGGREGRGRIYLPGAPAAAVAENGQLNGTTAADLDTAFANFHAQMIVDNMDPVVLHNSATTPTPIDVWSCDALAATQRRRLRR